MTGCHHGVIDPLTFVRLCDYEQDRHSVGWGCIIHTTRRSLKLQRQNSESVSTNRPIKLTNHPLTGWMLQIRMFSLDAFRFLNKTSNAMSFLYPIQIRPWVETQRIYMSSAFSLINRPTLTTNPPLRVCTIDLFYLAVPFALFFFLFYIWRFCFVFLFTHVAYCPCN